MNFPLNNYIDNKISLKQEIWRKLNHLLISFLPISYFFLEKQILLYFILPICTSVILVDYYRHKFEILQKIFQKIFGKILRDHEMDQLSGASYFSLAAIIIFSLFPKTIAINAFLILAISDSAAAIIGKKFQTGPFFEKSFGGSMTFFISALTIIFIIGQIMNEKILYYVFSIVAIYVTTIIEARPSLLKIDDNFSIPISYSLVMLVFNMIWIYDM